MPYKGQVLNQLAAWWFDRTADLVANHVVAVPDPNVLVARAATTLPVEVVVRGYITGVTSTSLWKPYAAGARTIYGYHFPDGLRKNTALPAALVTPTTKPPAGSTVHDEPLTWAEVVERGLVDAAALGAGVDDRPRAVPPRPGGRRRRRADPRRHQVRVRRSTADGELLLIDEVHTPDSSRYWVAATYEDRLAAGEEPESLDKEVVRRAFVDAGYRGDGEPPARARRRLDRDLDPLHRRLPTTHRAAVRARCHPRPTPASPRASRRSERNPHEPRPRARPRPHQRGAPRRSAACIGISTPHGEGVAQLTFFGLFALQHRGQEAAGIAVSDGQRARVHKQPGLVSHVFTNDTLKPLTGYHSIGHTRYSTTGSSNERNIQPFLVETMHGPLALAHNGNIVNTPALRDELLNKGFGLTATSDSEVMTLMLAAAGGKTWEERIERTLPAWKGAFSLVLLAADRVLAVRDPWGFRPLSVGRLPHGGHAVASETCALSTLGCVEISEVQPGEIVTLQGAELHRRQALAPARDQARCTFEFVYFSRPDSKWNGRNVHHSRELLGAELAAESAVDADVVIPVPDSSIPAAIGYSKASGVPFNDGLIKNRYIGRTFIEPTQEIRDRGVALKFNALSENLAGKRVIMIDDSLVRGTTAGPLVKLIRDAGATEVHVRITCPPIMHPCHFGVDMGHDGDLIAARLTVDEIRDRVGADSLEFLSLEGMMRAVGNDDGAGDGFCNACFTGRYPLEVGEAQAKLSFEGVLA